MGNYATQAELKARFDGDAEVAYLTDTEETGIPDTGVLDDCIESAEADINSRIGKRYATPVVVTGNVELTALLKRKALDLAEYYLLVRSPSISDQKEKQAERAWEWAAKVADGTFVLSGAATPPSTASRAPLATWTGSDRDLTDVTTRIFSRETMAAL
jgi:phage gp36-like protein